MASGYPNHYTMKKNRIIKLKQAKGKCEVCGKPAYVIHHIDFSVDNHKLSNLIILCNHCHKIIHSKCRMGDEFAIYNLSNFKSLDDFVKYYASARAEDFCISKKVRLSIERLPLPNRAKTVLRKIFGHECSLEQIDGTANIVFLTKNNCGNTTLQQIRAFIHQLKSLEENILSEIKDFS